MYDFQVNQSRRFLDSVDLDLEEVHVEIREGHFFVEMVMQWQPCTHPQRERERQGLNLHSTKLPPSYEHSTVVGDLLALHLTFK